MHDERKAQYQGHSGRSFEWSGGMAAREVVSFYACYAFPASSFKSPISAIEDNCLTIQH